MKNIFISIIALTLISACKKESNPFLISKSSIGLLTDSTQIKDIEDIYANDSLVRHLGKDEYTGSKKDIEVFDKFGNLLLILSPKQVLDSTSTIATIKVIDPRFKTEKGLNPESTFADIKNNYTISGIQNTLSNVIISVDDINGFFTIDKKELPSELRFDMNKKIEAINIPDAAKIRYFMIGWYL